MPPVRIFDVEWDDKNLQHLSGHEVHWIEVDQAIRNAREIRRNPNKDGAADSMLVAETDGGRLLRVFGNYNRRGNSFRPITAWEVR